MAEIFFGGDVPERNAGRGGYENRGLSTHFTNIKKSGMMQSG